MDGIAQADRDDVDRRVGDLAQRFVSAGWGFFIVGGVVRDLFLGRPSGDIDVTTDATPADTSSILGRWADTTWDQGARFGTVGARKGDVIVEVTTHRSEKYHADSRKPKVEFSSTIDGDLARRDFTINAMAIQLPSWRLIDPFDGRTDLAKCVLRTPLTPEIAFSDDPLRMLRAARFSSGYQLTTPIELENAMGVMAERLDIVSRERISEEFSKFLLVERPSSGIQLLHRTGLMERLFPGISNHENLQAQAIDLVSPDLELRWACLLWSVVQEGTLARRALTRLRTSNATASRVGAIIEAARVLTEAKKNDQATARRLLQQTRHDLEPAVELLSAYEQPPLPAVLSAIDRVRELEGNEEFQIPLDGNEVAELIGGEGPLVGQMLGRLMEQRLRVGPLSKKEATALIQDWQSSP
jgi:poly(A) polymerase